jgi:CheY-like chemotaxis protein/tRNA A-37 threonylcarbamoyl transferase component Bud32
MQAQVTAPATVLVADDNPEARRMLQVRIEREGYRVLLVEHGRQALELLAREPVDAILLDINMPEMDGYQVLAAVKADARLAHVPILIISGGGDHEDLVRCIELGAVDYLPKPFNQAVLRARLSTCIAGKRQRDEELSLLQQAQGGDLGVAAPAPSPSTPPAVPTPSAEAPQRVAGIAIQRLLGRGSMGNVWLGHHGLLDLPVAVKLLLPQRLRDQEMHARILREARVAARLAHRNIVRLVEVGDSEHGMYLAYEYVDGGTLQELLQRSPDQRLGIGEAVRITAAIAAGLEAVNAAGMTHRDIKPENILISREGEVKIADLGLAKQRNVASPVAVTGEHILVGTPVYMAPEQIECSGDLDIRCDLYALGAVLYRMLTGAAPFAGSTTMAVLAAHLFQPVSPPTRIRPEMPARLEAICLKLLAKSPSDRYAGPELLRADLEGLGLEPGR